MAPVLRVFLATIGLISLGLGIIGAFLPLLPTTPFLLLSAACFVRSSRRLYAWLINHPQLGPFVRNYRDHRSMTVRIKVVTLVLLWVTIGYSALAVAEALWLRLLLLAIAGAVTAHVATLGTIGKGGSPP